MLQETHIITAAHVIQLAVAPVFLITGISGMLSVMTSRLGRIVDRGRVVEASAADGSMDAKCAEDELRHLSRRGRFITVSIGLCTLTALLVSAIIAMLFIGSFLSFDVSLFVALFFVVAMLAFIVALLFFLREVFIAIGGLEFRQRG
ncbi:hypothetical protein ThidrDRAFT_0798 [Thiorhodococcus drewsii AZ1]|uniref:DUF2721 domain-containing protein n=1 Tax=Thiorhodococcus drewsii AZ1 TaxID=765913 RepID=G2DXS1_9GAMM|nr:DUF2721 domain-containing protein [Thiorhodococcus drewsii]EGV33120.1 hypothetical protein ThidrDRAFT_0798 [Thiorhodococcus drewsii AZ1]